MLLDHCAKLLDVIFVLHFFNCDHGLVQIAVKMTVFIQNVGDSSAHSRSKVLSCFSKHCHTSAGHIFTSVLTYPFYNGIRSGIAEESPTFWMKTVIFTAI